MTGAGRATSRLFLKRRDDVVAFELDGAVRDVEGEVVVAELVPKRAAEGVLLVATAHGKGVPLVREDAQKVPALQATCSMSAETVASAKVVEVFIPLLNEGTDVMRP